MSRLRLSTSTLVILILTACAFTRADEPVLTPTATPARVLQMTPVPTLQREIHPVATPQPEVTAVPAAIQCLPEADVRDVRYTIAAEVDYPSRSLQVEQEVDYVNRDELSLADFVFIVRPHSLPGVFTLETVQLGTEDLSYELAGQRLTVELPRELDPGCAIRLKLNFRLHVPEIDRGSVNAYKGYLGFTNRQINLGHWLPTIAVRQDDGWLLHEEIPIGEQDVLAEADWDVTFQVKNAPEDMQLAAPGKLERHESDYWHFFLVGGRDFSVSMSAEYNVSTQVSESGVTVELYTFDDALIQTGAGAINSPAFALDVATKALTMYADLFGAYPYERMIVVQSDFPDGMEFSGLVFVGGEYFRGFSGPTSYLMLITIHEIAHQWWYGRVGSDQALNPWLDEALATYSEYVFIEEYFPALKDWWWTFRVDSLSPEGFVDSTVYEFESRRAYINAVYLRGVRMLQELRLNLGTDAFYDWLRRYSEAGSGQVVTPDFFWSLLSPEQFAGTAAIREKYMKHAQLIVISPSS